MFPDAFREIKYSRLLVAETVLLDWLSRSNRMTEQRSKGGRAGTSAEPIAS
jgi:hypothetical protein